MFLAECTSLSAGPSRLLAKQHAECCYGGMFESCCSLKVGPIVEAEQMEVDSLYDMYGACSSLTSATLPIDAELADECYAEMFYGCTSLSAVPKLPSPEACSEHSNAVDTMLFNTGRPVQILDNTVDEIAELIQNEHLIGYAAWTTNPIVIYGSDGTITATYASSKWTLEITYST